MAARHCPRSITSSPSERHVSRPPLSRAAPAFADFACGPHIEDADAAALAPETVEALRHPHKRGIVGPHTSVDQPVRLHPMRGKKHRRRRSGQRHLHCRHSPVASKIWMMRGAEQMDVIRGQVVAGNCEPYPRISQDLIAKAVLQHRSQLNGAVSRLQKSSPPPVDVLASLAGRCGRRDQHRSTEPRPGARRAQARER